MIYPEYDMALRLVQFLTRDHVMDYLQLSKNISLIEIKNAFIYGWHMFERFQFA